MSQIYCVGVFKSDLAYSLTIRCLAKSTSWTKHNNTMRSLDGPIYTILFEGSQTQAEQFAHVIRAAYALLNVPTAGSLK